MKKVLVIDGFGVSLCEWELFVKVEDVEFCYGLVVLDIVVKVSNGECDVVMVKIIKECRLLLVELMVVID